MKKIEAILIIVFVLLVFATAVFAQETSQEIAKKYGIVFPIAELGNCTSLSSCREFCEDPVNQNTCVEFAKKKGFYREDKVETDIRNNDFWEKTRLELGCDSESSCRALCEQPQNFDKCSTFAKEQGLNGGHTEDPARAQILEKAKTVLGCNSYESCTLYCSQDANREKCSQFAQQVGLRGGEKRVGPGGCTSEETCAQFCSDPNNYQVCSGFTSSTGGKFSGPGGCNSEESCRAYCQTRPQECGYGGPSGNVKYDPSEMCNKTPNCSWSNNICRCGSYGGEFGQQAGDYADFCRQNPEKCGGGQSGGFESSRKREEFEKFCSENPEKCGGTSQPTGAYSAPTGSVPPQGGYNPPPKEGYSTDPATGCVQAGGSWVNGSCQFSGSSNTTSSPQTSTTTVQSSGGSTQPDPATECAKVSGCSWTGSTCSCGSVQGAKTIEKLNFFQSIWKFLFGPRR